MIYSHEIAMLELNATNQGVIRYSRRWQHISILFSASCGVNPLE
jgi:hypothetical protein